MKLVVIFLLLGLGTLQVTLGSSVHPKTLSERHSIVKRLAEDGQIFTEHDVAIVLHEKAPNAFHRISKRDLRSVADDNSTQRVRLELSSGSRIHLRLKKRSIFHEDTAFMQNSPNGLVARATPLEDCYTAGDVESNGLRHGFVSLAMCTGLHGTAISNGMEYYIHPVDHVDDEHQVHILSRRAADNETEPEIVASDGIPVNEEVLHRYRRTSTVTAETYKTATSFVIELAVFIDAHYWKRLQEIAPGREDEYVLVSMAATNALFSNKDKVGYDASIKIKLYENWFVDPEEYEFQQSIFTNLRNFCTYTRSRYQYDMHFLFTGVTQQQGPAVGVAYLSAVCSNYRCGNTYATSYNRYYLVAHEIGHNLGFNHHGSSKCPQEIKNQGGGFMGGGNGLDFSPCNKWELQNVFSRGKAKCLFEETRELTTSDEYENLPKTLLGQYHNPDEACRFLSGDDYELFRPFDFRGNGECAAFMCINRNQSSPEYRRIKRRSVLVGYTCGDEMFCDKETCSSWDKPGIGWDPNSMRANKRENHWSDWSKEWSPCSKSCGKGVQLKRRRCIFSEGPFLSPYCKGSPIKSRLCNEDPCPGTSVEVNDQRKNIGNAICSNFLKNDVQLHVQSGSTYLNESRDIWVWGKIRSHLKTKKCFLMCARKPSRYNYIDSIYPDGTPCTESSKNPHKRQRFNIDLRCVDGACVEFSDCPDNEQKDNCGVCGGDPINCVNKQFKQSDDVAQGERKVLGVLPAGTRSIDMNMRWWENRGIRMELWNAQGEKIIGNGGRFGRTHYRGNDVVSFANTTWQYDHGQYVRADGPIDQELVVKVLRQKSPIKRIWVTYLLPGTRTP